MRRSGAAITLGVASVTAVLAVYLLRVDRVAGLIVDDGWYVLLAQALARGYGYTMMNAPTPGLVPIDPPGFSAVLSLVFRVFPHFPDNVVVLKSVSIAAMLAAGLASYHHFRRYRDLDQERALGLAVAAVLTPGFVFLATSAVMSEGLFTAVQLFAVIFVERVARARGAAWARDTCLAGGLSAAAMMVRSAGIALPAAAVLFLAYRRLWKHAGLFACAVAVCVLPWTAYSRAHRPSFEQQMEHGGAHALTYRETFWLRWAGDQSLGTITAAELPRRIRDNLADVFGRSVGAIVAPAIFRGADESGQEVVGLGGTRGFRAGSMGGARSTMLIAFAISAVAALGFVGAIRRGPTAVEFLTPVALGIIVLWPHWTYRFVLPLAPFLLFYLTVGVEQIAAAVGRVCQLPAWTPARVSRIAVLCVLGLSLADHVQYILLRRAGTPDAPRIDWLADAHESDDVVDWVGGNVPQDAVLATTNPPLLYLRTGRKTVAIDDPAGNWARWKREGVKYLVALRPSDLPNPALGYTVLYRSARRGLWVIAVS